MVEHVVDFEEALGIVLGAVEQGTPAVEHVALLDGRGRVLAAPVLADRDQPPFDRSTRDGFAVRASELVAGSLAVVGQVKAGSVWAGPLPAGAAVEIMTGAPMPEASDAVLMVEHAVSSLGRINPAPGRSLAAGDNVVRRGSEARAGEVVLATGMRIGAAEIALAAACGCVSVPVYARARVSIVATGDELVELAETPGPESIRNSNSYALAAMVAAAGGEPVRLPIARDLFEEVTDRVLSGRRADLLLFSGGVSMGAYDLVEEALEGLGAEFLFTGVRMQPGKPVVFGRLPRREDAPECLFFGLPGNPVSTEVTFHCFAELAVRVLAGETEVNPRWAQATLSAAVDGRPGLTRLLPARMDGVTVRIVGWQGSGDLAANARANCYAELLPGRAYLAGEAVRVLLR